MPKRREKKLTVEKIHVEGLRKFAEQQRDKRLQVRLQHLKKKEHSSAALEKIIADIHAFYMNELKQIIRS